jgi:chromosome segregation ATPase
MSFLSSYLQLDTCVRAIMGASAAAAGVGAEEGASSQAAASAASAASAVGPFLALGSHPLMDGAQLSATTPFGVGEWCPAEAYEQAAGRQATAEMSAEIRELLSSRASYLTRALERLSTTSAAISPSLFESTCSSMLKSTESEKLSLQAELARVTASLGDMGRRLFTAEARRRKAEKELDSSAHVLIPAETAAAAAAKAAPGAGVRAGETAAVVSPRAGPGHVCSIVEYAAGNGAASRQDQSIVASTAIGTLTSEISALRKEVDVLARQVAEAEGRRSVAERSLNAHLTAPPEAAGGDSNDGDSSILLAMKHKFTEHILFLQAETAALRARMEASQGALSAVGEGAAAQIESLSAAARGEVAKLTDVCAENDKQIAALEAENEGLRSLRLQAAELSLTVDTLRAECNALREQKRKLVSAIGRLEGSLSQSRAREVALCASSSGSGSSGSSGSAAPFATVTTREGDLAGELEDAKAQMSDLFLEIETVVNSEETSREQCARVLQKMADSQQTQQRVIEENSLLNNEVKSLRTKLKEKDVRFANLQVYNTQQDALLNQLKSNEKKAFLDHSRGNQSLADSQAKIMTLEAALLEAEGRLSSETARGEALRKRWASLTERVNNLTNELDGERKKRMKFESASKKHEGSTRMERTHSNSSQASEGGGGGHNQEMLDLTLSMLRCSICRDRFKSVAITRCFHLFCKECIDENLRNRQRKCPACGEKFGQDDVRAVFFTH